MSSTLETARTARDTSALALLPWLAITAAAGLLAVGTALESPLDWLAFALLGLVVLGLLLWKAPALAVGMFPLLILPPQFAKVFAHEVGLLVVLPGLIVHGIRTRADWLTRLDPIEAVLALMVLWGILSGFWAESSWWWLFGVRKVGVGLLALWVSWRLARCVRPEHMRIGLTATIWCLSLYTLLRAAASGALSTAGWVDRKRSTDVGWGTSNYIAAILVLMLPTALEVALRDTRRGVRIFAWLALPMAALVMTVSASRGGVLFVLFIVLLALTRKRVRGNAIALAASVVGAGALVALSPAGPRFLSRFTDAQELGSVVVRFLYYREGWRRLAGAWPLGSGLGQSYSTVDRLGTEDPHNYWLVIGYELGLVGLALWIAFLVLLWKRIRRIGRDPATEALGFTLGLTFAISQLNCLFEPTFQGLHYHFLFFWIFGGYLGSLGPTTSAPLISSRTSRSGTNPLHE